MIETFSELLDKNWQSSSIYPGALIRATVVEIAKDVVTVNANLKSEGYIPINEFYDETGELEIKVGDEIDVILDSLENGYGETILSREKAKKQIAWFELTNAYEQGEIVRGLVRSRVKGGFTVELGKVKAFLPGSLVDIRPTREPQNLEGQELDFKIIKMDTKRNNIVVSRRAVIKSDSLGESRIDLDEIKEGQIIKGVIKNLTDYGAFIDLGGIDGLLHITDISWKRIKHPSDILNLGEEISVKVLKFDKDKKRVSLGMKQLSEDPWVELVQQYPIGTRLKGKVTNITDYGCFVDIEGRAEGLVHMSEMDWTNKNIHPNKVVNVGDEIEVEVLDVDDERRRISLGMKQCVPNPWENYASNHSKGEQIRGVIKSITDFGIFVGLDGNIDGLIHLSDLSWNETSETVIRQFTKGQEIDVIILSIDPDRERISLGIKQLKPEPFSNYISDYSKGSIVEGKIIEVTPKMVHVELSEGVMGNIRSNDLSTDDVEDARSVVNVGDQIEAKIVGVDKKTKVLSLSVKAKSIAEEKEALKEFKQKDQDDDKATLGDIMKAHIRKEEEDK